VAFLPFAPVDPPVPQAERYRLLTVANGPIESFTEVRVGPDGQRIEVEVPVRVYGGVTYEPMFCGQTHDYPIVCAPEDSPGESPGTFEKIFDALGAPVEAEPFLIYSSLQCGSAGHDDMAAWMSERVRARFASGEATGIERNVSRIMAAMADVPVLTPPDPTNITTVVATLEQWLYGVQDVMSTLGPTEGIAYNYRGYLHATPRVAAYAGEAHIIEQDGIRKVTPLGTVWSFGGGYSGALPGAAAAVDGTDAVYISGQVTIWRDAEIQVPTIRQVFDRGTNQWHALAERAYAVSFDCGVAAAPFEYGAVSP
jgi:hypothetical protein